MKKENAAAAAVRAAFPHTVPVMMGYLFLGSAFGILMTVNGFDPIYTVAMSLAVFAGSMQFVAVDLLVGAFDPGAALALTLLVNARHLFYGISMLDKYKDMGRKRWYLIFGLTDETFSINCTAELPQGVDRGKFYLFVTLLDHSYWVCGSAVGGLFGSLVHFNTEGLDFVMTALLVVIFLNQLMKEKDHISAALGVGITVISLMIFGAGDFIIPAMIAIIAALTLLRKPVEKGGGER